VLSLLELLELLNRTELELDELLLEMLLELLLELEFTLELELTDIDALWLDSPETSSTIITEIVGVPGFAKASAPFTGTSMISVSDASAPAEATSQNRISNSLSISVSYS